MSIQLHDRFGYGFARYVAAILMTCGVALMFGCSEKVLELRWEWPAGRQPSQTLEVRVDKVKADGGGLFGIRNSPSMADGFPNPMILEGELLGVPSGQPSVRVHLRYPAHDLPAVAVGDRLGLAVLDGNVCIGASKLAGR